MQDATVSDHRSTDHRYYSHAIHAIFVQLFSIAICDCLIRIVTLWCWTSRGIVLSCCGGSVLCRPAYVMWCHGVWDDLTVELQYAMMAL